MLMVLSPVSLQIGKAALAPADANDDRPFVSNVYA